MPVIAQYRLLFSGLYAVGRGINPRHSLSKM
nr:MAG TPA: hypothetical protein [Caudoviricetes sp.]